MSVFLRIYCPVADVGNSGYTASGLRPGLSK